MAMDATLGKLFSDYPNVTYDSFSVTLTCNRATSFEKILKCLAKLPVSFYDLSGTSLNIHIPTLHDFSEQALVINVILNIARKWKSLHLYLNDVEIPSDITVSYLFTYLSEQSGKKFNYIFDMKELPKELSTSTKRKNYPQLKISTESNESIICSVIDAFADKYFNNLVYTIVQQKNTEAIVTVEHDTILFFSIPQTLDFQYEGIYIPLVIQELTFNDLFKPNITELEKSLLKNNIQLFYLRFKGLSTHRKCEDYGIYGFFDYVNKCYPNLELKRRYEEHPGHLYHFVIFEMEDVYGKKAYAVGNTRGAIHDFVLKTCRGLEQTPWNSILANGISGLSMLGHRDAQNFYKALLSWKGKKIKWRLENKMTYFSIDVLIKEENQKYLINDKIYRDIEKGVYANEERSTYKKPINKWKTEELVYNLTKQIYGSYQVLYQHRPSYLKTSKGQLSYDIYICGLKVAIEYQGKQHYEPVAYFGGEQHFINQQERDAEKLRLSKKNGIQLIYISYWDNITSALIKQRVEATLKERNG